MTYMSQISNIVTNQQYSCDRARSPSRLVPKTLSKARRHLHMFCRSRLHKPPHVPPPARCIVPRSDAVTAAQEDGEHGVPERNVEPWTCGGADSPPRPRGSLSVLCTSELICRSLDRSYYATPPYSADARVVTVSTAAVVASSSSCGVRAHNTDHTSPAAVSFWDVGGGQQQ